PVLANPFRKEIVADSGEGYELGIVDGLKFRPRDRPYVPKNDTLPGVAEAAATREGRIFLDWARFPYFEVQDGAVYMIDARYSLERGEGFARLRVNTAEAPPPRPLPTAPGSDPRSRPPRSSGRAAPPTR
ncbi:MAG TPA: hypothetical protein VFR31_03180, partial [Thermoanaerobaculia bacterium]|nr:hypothetical protein [Thermoanaerobaculia bacterium]